MNWAGITLLIWYGITLVVAIFAYETQVKITGTSLIMPFITAFLLLCATDVITISI